jgi:UDP-N-acetyl-D-mannosaminuronic acid dehydrogenase
MDYPIRTVCVVGLGYIGLPTAATLASRGIEVIGVDINPEVVKAVNAGQPYFSEPDLDMLLRAATTLGKLRATSEPEPADAFVIAVPTPFNADRSPNLDYIWRPRMRSRQAPSPGNVVILNRPHRSATGGLRRQLARLRPDFASLGTHSERSMCMSPIARAGAAGPHGARADRE